MVLSHRQVVMVGGPQPDKDTAQTPTHLIPVTSFSAEEVVNQLLDNGRRGPHAADFRAPAGVKLVNITIEGAVQADPGTTIGHGIGMFLRNIFGSVDVATSLTSSLWNHDFQLPANPSIEYLTLETDNQVSGSNDRRFVGCRVQELVFSWNAGEGVLSYTATLTGRHTTLVAATNLLAQAVTIEDPMEGWNAEVAFSGAINYGTPQFTKLISAEWTLSRAPSVLYTGQNTQVPDEIYLGPLACTVALVMNYDDDTELAKYRAGTQVNIVNSFIRNRSDNDNTIRRFIIANSLFSILESPVTVDISGEHATIALGARALYNTDASEIITDASITGDASVSVNAGPVQVRLTDLRNSVYNTTA